MNLEDRFYTSTEVAEILGVSLRSVYRYLEEDKLQAEVKTATGRHRFTKKNILDFLYPNKDNISQPVSRTVESNASTGVDNPSDTYTEPEAAPIINQTAIDEEEVEEDLDEPAEEPQEEEVDWLAKFRAAAEKHRLEAQMAEESKPASRESLSSLASEEEEEVEKEPEKPAQNEYYYKSNVGGLKELAQYINKSARNSNVPYAFTMNAGLSLHKMIRPFSILHIYVKPEDKEFFEKALELTESNASSAQLGIFIDNGHVIENRKEIHGLYVVNDVQLRKDLLENGEVDLASEFDEVADL